MLWACTVKLKTHALMIRLMINKIQRASKSCHLGSTRSLDKIYCFIVQHRNIIKYFNFCIFNNFIFYPDLNPELENAFVFFMGFLSTTKGNLSLAPDEDVTLPKPRWKKIWLHTQTL